MISLRTATLQDKDLLSTCVTNSTVASKFADRIESLNDYVVGFVSNLISNGEVFVATTGDGERVGFVSVVSSDATPFIPRGGSNWWNAFDFIRFLYVCESSRNRGVGQQLLQHSLSNSTMQFLYTPIAESNVDVQRFFEKAGFKRIAHCVEKVGGDSSVDKMPQATNVLTRPFVVDDDRILIRDGLRSIFDAEGRLEIYLLHVEEEELEFFVAHYSSTTLVAIDDTSHKALGWLAFSVTNQFPFGIDFGAFENEYLFISYIYVAPEGRRQRVASKLLADVMQTHSHLKIVRSSYVAGNDVSEQWHRGNGFRNDFSIWGIDRQLGATTLSQSNFRS